MAQGMTTYFFAPARQQDRISYCPPDRIFMDRVSPHPAAAGAQRHTFGRKHLPHPILLQTGLKRVPESLNRYSLVCISFSHKTLQLQMVTAYFSHRNRQNKYIRGHGSLATC